ncbi:MAG: carbohydrate ABC transporter permease [Chloroflexota bacterium]
MNRFRRSFSWGDLFSFLLLTVAAILVAMPLLWMFSTSLRPIADGYSLPPKWLPTEFRIENYAYPFQSNVPFGRLFWNNLKITLTVTVGQLLLCSLAGFAFARLRFPLREPLFILLLASLMIPIQVTVIPIFFTMRALELIDTHWAIILPSLVNAFGVFLMRQFFKTLPQELFDAAVVDGASHLRTFLQIALPLASAPLATLAILTFNATWNSFFLPIIFLSSWDKMTLTQGIAFLSGQMGPAGATGNPSIRMAAVTMALIPVLLVFLVAQRWIIQAFAQTGIKG